MSFFKRVPLPLCGVALGFAALGNLLAAYSPYLKTLCGILAFVGILFVTCKYLTMPDAFVTDMKNPVTASVSGTYTMTLMLLAGYIKPILPVFAMILWYVAIVLHFVLIVYFTLNFILKIKIPDDLMKVVASYFIVYVGIVVASVTAPAFNNIALGKICFLIGFILYIPLFFYVSFRYIKLGNKKIEAKALACIYAAPASLCVAGYISSFEQKNAEFLSILYDFSFVSYLIAVLVILDVFKNYTADKKKHRFYPSYAGFTFPFVISAIAGKQFYMVSKSIEHIRWGIYSGILFVNVQIIIAIILMLFTAIKFAIHVFSKE